MRTLGVIAATLAAAAMGASPFGPGSAAWTQAQGMLAKMSQAQKLQMVHGSGGPYVGDVPRVGPLSDGSYLPPWNLEDGPQGVADGVQHVTCWPSALTVVQSWDPDAMLAYGAAMGREQYLKGTNVMLGPGVNLARVPWCGRNFEYQGEDPHLASVMVAAEVRGIQSNNVSGCVKHYVQNNQEYDRSGVSANVPQRAAKELYYKPFAAAVDAGVGSAMCSYNRINNTWACENAVTLGELKDDMGFAGWVMSDWGATHSTVPAALGGLDQQMPDAGYFGSALAAAIASGQVPQSRLDDMVLRMLTAYAAVGVLDDQPTPDRNITAHVNSTAHNWLARRLAEESITLLSNKGVLPVNPASVRNVVVLGDATTVHGGGSGGVNAPYIVTPQQGLQNLAAELGLNWNVAALNGSDINAAVAAARTADLTVVVVATYSHEGADRANLSLPLYQDQLVAAVAAAQPKHVVVARCPGACVMPWADAASAILFELMPGQESGNSIAGTIFGQNVPSGKLPVTFPADMNSTWLSLPNVPGPINPMMYPGTIRSNSWIEADYDEGLLIGYRWFDSRPDLAPLFPFGHGLSYTTFTYSSLAVAGTVSAASSATVYATVCNSGTEFEAAEVAQLYIGYPAAAPEQPPKALKGFQKVRLVPGQCAGAAFPLAAADLQTWSVEAQAWQLVPGTYSVFVGSSSRDIRLTGSLTVTA